MGVWVGVWEYGSMGGSMGGSIGVWVYGWVYRSTYGGCHTLFLPATQRDLLMDLSRVQEEDLTPEYREERDALRKELMEKIEPKEKNGKLVWICLTFCSNKILLSTYVFICLFDIM